jgi:hypothetical protein
MVCLHFIQFSFEDFDLLCIVRFKGGKSLFSILIGNSQLIVAIGFNGVPINFPRQIHDGC